MTDFVLTKISDLASLRTLSDTTDFGGLTRDALSGSEFRKVLETSAAERPLPVEKPHTSEARKVQEPDKVDRIDKSVDVSRKDTPSHHDAETRNDKETTEETPHSSNTSSATEDIATTEEAPRSSNTSSATEDNQPDIAEPAEECESVAELPATESTQIPTMSCFVDLLSPQTMIAMQSAFQETQGVPYVIIDNASVEDTRVSDLLTDDTLSTEGVNPKCSPKLVATNVRPEQGSVSSENYTYPEMTEENFAEELTMAQHERMLPTLTHEAHGSNAALVSVYEAEATTSQATTEMSDKADMLSVAAARTMAKASAARHSNVVRLPNPQSFKAEVFQQFRIGMIENLARKQTDFQIDLHPEALGHISMQMGFGEKHLHVQIVAANADTRALFENNPDMVYRIVEEAAGLTNMMSFTFTMNQGQDSHKEDSEGQASADLPLEVSSVTPMRWVASDRLLDAEI